MGHGRDPLSGDTIAAIATPQGRGAIALVRVSGPAAPDVLLRLAPSLAGALPEPRTQTLLPIHHPGTGELIDSALVTYFAAPRSFTGEPSVEIATHGGLLTPQLVLAAAYAAGARPAEPGEFTRRALLNGKLDLTQAEAILDLIDASSPAFHRAAVHQLDRGLTERIAALRDGVLRVEAMIAYGIDFPDEDEPPVPLDRVLAAARDVVDRIATLLRTAPEGSLLRDGALVVLAGRPNAGKSSLFNALLGLERSIVTDIPGTTRDAVEATAILDGYPFRLVDTAGIRETIDPVEARGVEVAHRYLAGAEAVVFCAEAGADLSPADRGFLDRMGPDRVLVARTKTDRLLDGEDPGDGDVAVSVVSGAGLDHLRDLLAGRVFGRIRGQPAEAPIVTRERHVRALSAARAEMDEFVEATLGGIPAELAATHLGAAAAALEEIIGAVTPDDVLGAVFSAFCVGK